MDRLRRAIYSTAGVLSTGPPDRRREASADYTDYTDFFRIGMIISAWLKTVASCSGCYAPRRRAEATLRGKIERESASSV